MSGTTHTQEEVAKLREQLEQVTGNQVARDMYAVKSRVMELLKTYALAQKEKRLADVERLQKRAPVNDIPTIIGDLIDIVASSFVIAFQQIDTVRTDLAELSEGLDDDDDIDDDEDGVEFDLKSIEEAEADIKKDARLLDWVSDLGSSVPEDIKAIVAERKKTLEASIKDIAAAKDAIISADDDESDEDVPDDSDGDDASDDESVEVDVEAENLDSSSELSGEAEG